MDQALGTAVFAGMIGETFFGIFLTPAFFSVIMKIFARVPTGSSKALSRIEYGEQSRSPPHRKVCVVGPSPSKKPIFGGICSLLGDFRHPKLPRCDADNPLEVKAELTLVRETGSYRHVC